GETNPIPSIPSLIRFADVARRRDASGLACRGRRGFAACLDLVLDRLLGLAAVGGGGGLGCLRGGLFRGTRDSDFQAHRKDAHYRHADQLPHVGSSIVGDAAAGALPRDLAAGRQCCPIPNARAVPRDEKTPGKLECASTLPWGHPSLFVG